MNPHKQTNTHTCCLVWAFWTYSRPTLMRGVRMARLNSSTLMPSRWHSFWAAVSSGIEAWSVFFSLWNVMLPNCSTAEITFNIAGKTRICLSSQNLNSDICEILITAAYFFFLQVDSSPLKPIMVMESIVCVKFSESLWPGTGSEPPQRKRYWSALPSRSSSTERAQTNAFLFNRPLKIRWLHKYVTECERCVCSTIYWLLVVSEAPERNW